MGEIIMILLLLLPVIFIGLIAYVMKAYDNTNDESDKDTKDRVDNDTNDESDDGTKDRVDNDTNDESDKDTKDRVDNDTNDESDDGTVNIGDVFVYEPLCIISSDPFEDVSTVRDMDSSRTYIVDDLKTNYEGVVWVKYHTLISHRRKKCFYHTTPIDAFLYRTYKHNELKHLFE